MDFVVSPSSLTGRVRIPGSKSHTIRALMCSLYSHEESIIRNPLISADTLSARAMVESLGAHVLDEGNVWRVQGGGRPSDRVIDVGNSGTSLYFGIAAAALNSVPINFDGDDQIRRRTAQPLIDALEKLNVAVSSNNGCAPLTIKGPLKGGKTVVHAVSSQYLSALLLALPLADGDTEIEVPLLNEKPYVMMTLQWMDRCGIQYEHDDACTRFFIKGRQKYKGFDCSIPADFSSASFFAVAGAICGGPVTLEGLDFNDLQGDSRVFDILRDMGAHVDADDSGVTVKGPLLRGGDFDLNEIPDSLPILSVAACFAPGKTRLYNVEHARIKETDRITTMREELMLMGGKIIEHLDGLAIEYSPLIGGDVNGHGDHRIVMSCAVAACASQNSVRIRGCKAVAITFPEFQKLMRSIGAEIKEV